ncbi:MAG: sel1 repeat family protein [Campylobacteraceae bacterium]|nr:sel1 repeat family protein [Campylobacteraceae bacterium]
MKRVLVFLGLVLTFALSQNQNDKELEKMIFENPKFLSYDENCTKGDSWACSEIGMTFYKYQNNEKALEYFTKACDIEFCVGCELKGFLLVQKGEFEEAFETFTKACDNNSSYSCVNLAKMYDLGYGVEQNTTIATELYMKACKLGDMGACQMLNVR